MSLYGSVSRDSEDEELLGDYVNGAPNPFLESGRKRPERIFLQPSSIDVLRTRWKSREYCQIRSCRDCRRVLTLRCCLSTVFLVAFFGLGLLAVYLLVKNPLISPLRAYDYIIVGSGPAGSIIARRLTDAGLDVLLLEAGGGSQYNLGGSDSFGGQMTRFDIPLFWSTIAQYPQYHWEGFNVPGVIAGKAVGGSGVENAMLYVRCTELDIARWNMSDEWSWPQLLQAYLDMESYCPPSEPPDSASTDPPYHTILDDNTMTSSQERIVTSRPTYQDPVGPQFYKAASAYGIKTTDDFNAPGGREGVGYFDFNIRNGIRDSVANRFLGPMLSGRALTKKGISIGASSNRISNQYANFDIGIHATVHKILMSGGEKTCHEISSSSNSSYGRDTYEKETEPESLSFWHRVFNNLFRHASISSDVKARAFGVQFVQGGILQSAYLKPPKVSISRDGGTRQTTNPSVVVSAGALGSPKLLMNSGIGPADVLQRSGVCSRIDSPQVGKNLMDHPTVGIVYSISPTLAAEYPNAYSFVDTVAEYIEMVQHTAANGDVCNSNSSASTGGFGTLGSVGLSTGAFLTSPYAKERSYALGLGGVTQPDIQLTVFPTVSEPHMLIIARRNRGRLDSTYNKVLITVSLMDPIARYELVLNRTDPIGSVPVFTLPGGTAAYLQELDLQRMAWGIQQVRNIVDTAPLNELLDSEISPGQNVNGDDLINWIQADAFTNSHWAGSNRMGTDSTSVNNDWRSDILSSVIDSRLRVRGVSGLYLADASVIPQIPTGNVHSTVALVGHQAAEFILGDNCDTQGMCN